MKLVEFVSVLLFLFFLVVIYAAEGILLLQVLIYKKIKARRIWRNFLSKPAILIHFLAISGFLCLLYGHFIEPKWIEVNKYTIKTDKLKNTSIRLVQISDLHCDLKELNENKAVEIINALEPDIIVFTGDSLNDPRALPLFKSTLKSLKAKIGKFAVKGNMSMYYPDLDLFSDTGFMELKLDRVPIQKDGETIIVAGLHWNKGWWSDDLFNLINGEKYTIFLHHYSDFIEKAEEKNVDLYLCGHTHGGQVCLPFYGALVTLSKSGKKYESGLYNVGKTKLYVNRGLGVEGGAAPRIRFLARPEIAVFDIQPTQVPQNE